MKLYASLQLLTLLSALLPVALSVSFQNDEKEAALSKNEENSNRQSVPTQCLNPTGTSCNWYLNCLERNRPCRGNKYPYSVEYGNVYCNLFTRVYWTFSSKARQWIDAVRKCLQVSLVDVLRPQNNGITCQEISKRAFDSHTCCYVNPSPGSGISICNLSWSDRYQVFKTVKGSLLTDFWETASEIATVNWICFTNSDQCG